MTAVTPVSGLGGGGGVAAVLARIGALEQRLGVAPPVRPAATASGSPTATSTASSSATSALDAAGAGADATGLISDLLGVNGSAATVGATTFDQVFDAAVASLEAGWAATSTVASASGPVASGSVAAGSGVAAASAGGLAATTPYAALFEAAGDRHGIPAEVLAAIGYVESRFRTDVVSSAGAVGMMQFLPSTAASMGVDPTDPASAIDGAARYLRTALDRFGSLEEAIASYNVGPGTIARAGGVQPGSQAERYLHHVLDAMGRV